MTDRDFSDHFSRDSSGYGRHRPHYPSALFAYLAGVAPSCDRVWDCATGSGQATAGLATHFSEVIATDASAAQIAEAVAAQRVDYRVRTAEDSGLEADSVHLITVAQALHWFDLHAFAAESARVLKPGGLIAAWTYNLLHVTPSLDTVIDRFYHDVLGGYSPPGRELVEASYRGLDLPFSELACPSFEMTEDWTFDRLLGYLETWSAAKRYEDRNGEKPVEFSYEALRDAWGDPARSWRVAWPLTVRVWTP